MGVLEKFSEHFIAQNPYLSDWFTGVAIFMFFIASPALIYFTFKHRYNRGRFIFQSKDLGPDRGDHLYMLDTMKGDLYFVDGKAYYGRVHKRDWKEERELQNSSPKL